LDVVDYARYLGALLFTLALLGGFLLLLRRFGPRLGLIGARVSGARGADGPRLAVVDTIALDARRRLIIVRDARAPAREHVILLGPASEHVVESRDAAAAEDNSGDNLHEVFKNTQARAR